MVDGTAVEAPTLLVKVEDAARILGISRSLAYELANRWLDGDQTEGLPCVRLGRRILVQRAALERLGGVRGRVSHSTPALGS